MGMRKIDAELNEAVAKRDAKAAARALDRGARARARDGQGYPVVVNAAWAGSAACLELLLAHGASVGARGPLHGKGDEGDPSCPGVTVLEAAADSGSLACVRAALRAGARVDVVSADLPAIVSAAGHCSPMMVAALLAAGADPNARWRNGLSALGKCVGSISAPEPRKLATARRLVEAGADVHYEMPGGTTDLSWAVHGGSLAAVRFLLEAGADPNAAAGRRHGAMAGAIREDRRDMLAALLDHGADPRAKIGYGISPMEAAATEGSVSCAAELASRGVDPRGKRIAAAAQLHGRPVFAAALGGEIGSAWERWRLARGTPAKSLSPRQAPRL